MTVRHTALFRWLESHSTEYAGKIIELRDEIEKWLSYIPATFPHYTRHTVRHSDEIVSQVSLLLFDAESPSEPVISGFSPTEAYITIVGAYLHDSGMVCSDAEKTNILTSAPFIAWLEDNSTRKARWTDISAFRHGANPPDESQRHFLADLQVRFLVAEYIRSRHHLRAGDIVRTYDQQLGRFSFGEPQLLKAVADICIGHGLATHELQDSRRFPDRRDIRGDKVNIRFLAILLRLGDLLDLSSDRACPLLLNAACPLPPESYPHWTQYRDIARDVAPERIEIVAHCETANEHRILRDWCKWIVDEVHNAAALMAHTARHREWKPPHASMGSEKPTIRVERSIRATYVPVDWKFELDETEVFSRLVRDVYHSPLSFVRELIQNSLDATRCALHDDLAVDGRSFPSSPTLVPETIRQQYPLHVELQTRFVANEMSGGNEERHMIIIDDCGIGMDRDIIQRHFLQVGRSFYATHEFRTRYAFSPTSQFGIGFLSVFAESDLVAVDTFKQTSGEPAIRLTLTGPRNYLLVEESSRNRRGTRVEVVLREKLQVGALTKFVQEMCCHVEFPIHVEEFGSRTTISKEDVTQFEDLLVESEMSYKANVFPMATDGIEGTIHIFSSSRDGIDDWAWSDYRISQLEAAHPASRLPQTPKSLVAFHGITVQRSEYQHEPSTYRIDLRDNRYRPTISRVQLSMISTTSWLNVILRERHSLVCQHIETRRKAGGTVDWRYLNRLWNVSPSEHWTTMEGTIPVHTSSSNDPISMAHFLTLPGILLISHAYMHRPKHDNSLLHKIYDGIDVPPQYAKLPWIRGIDLGSLRDDVIVTMFEHLIPSEHVERDGAHLVVLRRSSKRAAPVGLSDKIYGFASLGKNEIVGRALSIGHSYEPMLIFNSDCKLNQWWTSFNASELDESSTRSLRTFATRVVQEMKFPGANDPSQLATFLENWRKSAQAPNEQKPPRFEFGAESFSSKEDAGRRLHFIVRE